MIREIITRKNLRGGMRDTDWPSARSNTRTARQSSRRIDSSVRRVRRVTQNLCLTDRRRFTSTMLVKLYRAGANESRPKLVADWICVRAASALLSSRSCPNRESTMKLQRRTVAVIAIAVAALCLAVLGWWLGAWNMRLAASGAM